MGQVRQGEVGEKGRLLLRVYSNCVALKGMLSRVYSPQVPWSYLVSRDGRLDSLPAFAETLYVW